MPPRKPPTSKNKATAVRGSKTERKDSGSEEDVGANNKFAKKYKICQVIARVFTEGQQSYRINHCIEKMVKMFRELEYEDVFFGLRECTLFALENTAEDAPYRDYLFGFLTKVLIMRCNTELKNFDEEQEMPSEEEEESHADGNDSDEDELAGLMDHKKGSKKTTKGLSKKAKSKSKKNTEPKLTIVDRIIKDAFIEALEADSVVTRLNTCYVVSLILEDINDIVQSIYDKLRKTLVDNMSNKYAVVRAAAAKALLRFQEITTLNDVVTAAYKFHLSSDPDYKVRQAILQVIEPSKATMDTIIAKTRDVKDIVRKAAFLKICDRVNVKALSFEQRNAILKEGLHDRSPAIRSTVHKKLLVKWLNSCNNDVVELLTLVATEDETETISLMLDALFKAYLSQKQGDKTKLHIFVDNFRNKFLDARRLLLKQPLTVENTFLWYRLAKFLKENNVNDMISNDASDLNQGYNNPINELDPELDKAIEDMFAKMDGLNVAGAAHLREDSSSAYQEANSEMDRTVTNLEGDRTITGPTPPKKPKTTIEVEVELIDLILPQPPHLCHFLKRFAQTVDKTDFDEVELSDYEFVYDQLVNILGLVEIRDSCQTNILINTVKDIFNLSNLPSKLKNVCSPLMKYLHKNVFESSEELLKFTKNIIQEVYNGVAEEEMEYSDDEESIDEDRRGKVSKPPKEYTPAQITNIEMKFAEVSVALEELNDKMEVLIKNQDYLAAQELKAEKEKLEKEKDGLKKERLIARGEVIDSDDEDEEEAVVQRRGKRSSADHDTSVVNGEICSEDSGRREPQLDQHPKELMKCILIFSGCLEAGSFKETNTVIQSHLEKVCFPGILSESAEVRATAVRGIGLCCYTHVSIARRYLGLITQVVVNDDVSVRNEALKAIFDLVGQHGLQELKGEDRKEDLQTSSMDPTAAVSEFNLTEETNRTVEEEINASQNRQRLEEMDQFEKDFLKRILDQLNSNSVETKLVTTEGVCKLLLLGRIASIEILTKLLLMWYNEETHEDVRHFLGSWFPLFAFQNNCIRDASSGQLAFEEAFLPTLEAAFLMSSKFKEDLEEGEFVMSDKELENLISFMVNLMTDCSQVAVALLVAEKFLQLLRDNSNDHLKNYEDKVLSKALNQLYINTGTRGQLKKLRTYANLIIEILPTSFNRKMTKNGIARVNKFESKISSLLEEMPAGDLDTSQVSSAGDQSSHINSVNMTVRELASKKQRNEEEEDQLLEEEADDEQQDEINYSVLSQDISKELDTPTKE